MEDVHFQNVCSREFLLVLFVCLRAVDLALGEVRQKLGANLCLFEFLHGGISL